jgi:hypothetical protein
MTRCFDGKMEGHLRAVGLIAAVAVGMTQNGVPIDRIGVQGAYDHSREYEAEISEAYSRLLEIPPEAK